MLSSIKNLFGIGTKVDYAALKAKGTLILDVRSVGEFQGSHISGSMNIPLQVLQGSLSKLKKDTPIITCCASGIRSASAKSILAANGFNEVYNGGSWVSLNNKI